MKSWNEYRDNAKESVLKWYSNLKLYSKFPAKGTIAGSLVIFERLKSNYDLDIDNHTARGGSQISGASGDAVKKILVKFGESRPFVTEGGRTNRGLRGDIENLLLALQNAKLEELQPANRNSILEELQYFLVTKVSEFHSRQRLKIEYDPAKTTQHMIRSLLLEAGQTGKRGAVAQYLVGAKLQIRFPNIKIRNESYSAADVQSGLKGDFEVGDTVFHVTVSPMPKLYEKCERNLQEGFKVYILVPDETVYGTKQNADIIGVGRISVESIDSFIGQNVDELSAFSKRENLKEFLKLLMTYNQRVERIEPDKSLLIEIPHALKQTTI
jgi:hypothetical protein